MRYADYYDCDICNGNSVGMSLFIQGCPFHCQGCFNPETWNYDGGKEWTPEVEDKFLELVGRDYIKRVSFLGGSPLCDENIYDVDCLIQKIKTVYPKKQIWVYTGYTWENIINTSWVHTIERSPKELRQEVLRYIDVLVDGQFVNECKDLSLAFCGSTNQRIIDVKESIKNKSIILWKEPI